MLFRALRQYSERAQTEKDGEETEKDGEEEEEEKDGEESCEEDSLGDLNTTIR